MRLCLVISAIFFRVLDGDWCFRAIVALHGVRTLVESCSCYAVILFNDFIIFWFLFPAKCRWVAPFLLPFSPIVVGHIRVYGHHHVSIFLDGFFVSHNCISLIWMENFGSAGFWQTENDVWKILRRQPKQFCEVPFLFLFAVCMEFVFYCGCLWVVLMGGGRCGFQFWIQKCQICFVFFVYVPLIAVFSGEWVGHSTFCDLQFCAWCTEKSGILSGGCVFSCNFEFRCFEFRCWCRCLMVWVVALVSSGVWGWIRWDVKKMSVAYV